MRAVVTGQVGLDKKEYLQDVAQIMERNGEPVHLATVGDMMYAERPDVSPGRILDLPLAQLRGLRRGAFKDIMASANQHKNIIVNTHATFRWRHGLFYAFDYDQMKAFDADYYICLVDNIDAIHYRMNRDGHADHTLKDLMVWREEETLATELLSQIVRGHPCFYVQAIGHDRCTAETLAKLLTRPELKKAYLSFPMSHVMDLPDVLAEIEQFRAQMKNYFVSFDPGDLEEKHLCDKALKAAEQGHRHIETKVFGKTFTMDTTEMVGIIGDIDGQIYARDFMLIDQSDMIISYVPELPGGSPGLSSGVERELQHAHEAAKDVFVVWKPKASPSPFVTETATKVFRSVAEAVEFFQQSKYVPNLDDGVLFT